MENYVGMPLVYGVALLLIILYRFLPNNKPVYYITVFYITAIAALRGVEVGTDYSGYVESLRIFSSPAAVINYSSRSETGFHWLLYFANRMGLHYIVVYGLMFFISMLSVLRLAEYKKADKSWVLLLYFLLGYYFMSFNIVRQMFAISLILFFVPLLDQKKYKYFGVITLFIALAFHTSEILFLLLIPAHIYCNKIDKINKLVLYIALAVSFAMYYVAQRFLVDYILSLILFLGIGDIYSIYVELADQRESVGNTTSLIYTILGYTLIFFKKDNTHKFETYIVVLSLVIFNITNVMAAFAYRLFLDYNIFMLVLIPLMISEIESRLKRNVLIAIICVFSSVMFAYKYYLGNAGEVKPYYITVDKDAEY